MQAEPNSAAEMAAKTAQLAREQEARELQAALKKKESKEEWVRRHEEAYARMQLENAEKSLEKTTVN